MNNRVSSSLNREKITVNILRQSSTTRTVLPTARVLALLLVVPLLLAGCASPVTLRSAGAVSVPTGIPTSSSDSIGTGSFMEPAAVQKEYSAAVSTFPEPLPTVSHSQPRSLLRRLTAEVSLGLGRRLLRSTGFARGSTFTSLRTPAATKRPQQQRWERSDCGLLCPGLRNTLMIQTTAGGMLS
jgi:hypothetical protein